LREIRVTLKRELKLPVDASNISPDKFRNKTIGEIEALEMWEGNRRGFLGDIFAVSENTEPGDEEVRIRVVGNVTKVRKIGYKTSFGSILIEGDVGMYLGEEMSGGSILVTGDAGSWLGTKMKGGQIEVKGQAGDCVGAGYRGGTVGMKGGTITIHGNAGSEVGCWMANGTVRIRGNTGIFPGMHMSNGTILIEGSCEGRAGAQMRGGKVIIIGHIPGILPSFSFEEIQQRVRLGEEKIAGPFYAFSGDMNENGKGKLSVRVSENPQLKWCEKYLEA